MIFSHIIFLFILGVNSAEKRKFSGITTVEPQFTNKINKTQKCLL